MSQLKLTQHALKRMSQRSLRVKDADLIALVGTAVEGGYLVRAKDYQAIETALKQFLQRCKRLINKRIVVLDGRIVTTYHTNKSGQTRLLRRAHESDLHD